MQEKPKASAIIITGMHRSGTSCLAGSLQQNGLYLGKVYEHSTYNLKGNRENAQIMALNDSVLKTSGGSWDNLPEQISWTDEEAKKRDQIITGFVNKAEKKWGFKDPRALFTLPFWQEGLAEIQLVASLRHPLLVAKSLHKRAIALNYGDKMTVIKGLELWESYNKYLLSYVTEKEFPIISFDQPQASYLLAINILCQKVSLEKRESDLNSLFIEPSLINQKLEDHNDLIPDRMINLYDQLSAFCIT